MPNKRERENSSLSWVNMAVAPNGNLLALIDERGYMWLGTSDFKVIAYVDFMCMKVFYFVG